MLYHVCTVLSLSLFLSLTPCLSLSLSKRACPINKLIFNIEYADTLHTVVFAPTRRGWWFAVECSNRSTMTADHFCLKWNNYTLNMVTELDSLRNSEDLVDVTLSCDGQLFKAHKVVLSMCSSYFRNVFKVRHRLSLHSLYPILPTSNRPFNG